ncbi:hypothetical protein RND81_06G248200 [Saponaria officinalis]|uniref:Uncharacterized protein n=1 Tax=Saponaria officinalis TaxID=3572 RepID=A0AAW1KB15_SAPOF
MKKELEEKSLKSIEKSPIIWDLGSPLYDSFELASLSHIIERHMMTLPSSSLSSSSRLSSSLSSENLNGSRVEGETVEGKGEGGCNMKGIWKRKGNWEEVSKKNNKRSKVSGCFQFSCTFWKK